MREAFAGTALMPVPVSAPAPSSSPVGSAPSHSSYPSYATSVLSREVTDDAQYWRVSNGGQIGWQPSVRTVRFFTDEACTQEVPASAIETRANADVDDALCSGFNPGFGACDVAWDGDTKTSW